MQLLTTHKNVDFDALASVVAASLLYPEAQRMLPNMINPNVRGFLSIHRNVFSFLSPKDIQPEEVERLIVVDANRWMRLEGVESLMMKPGVEVHLWDHHPDIGDITPAWGRQELLGAATTLLVEEIIKKGTALSPIMATLFLTGIHEDTGHLTFPSTTPRDLRVCAWLLENGADLSVVQTILRPAFGPKQKDILFRMLADAERIKLNGHSFSIGGAELDGHVPGLGEVMSNYRNILNVDAAFGIFRDEKRDRCIVIGRSAPDSVDVGVLMDVMGGGGHPAAASAMLKGVSRAGVETWLKELLQNHQRPSIQISDLMSFPVESVPPEMPVHEAYERMIDKDYSGIPVMDGGRLVGILSRRDLKKLKKEIQWKQPVKAFMSRKLVTVSPRDGVEEAMRLLIKHDVGRLPVVEDDGTVIGILSRSDALIYYYDLIPD